MSNKVSSRQYAKNAVVVLRPENMGAGKEQTAVLPSGALLLAVTLVVATAFNSATTATATIKDDADIKFADAVDVKTAGAAVTANAPKHYPNGGTVSLSLAQTGAGATAGLAVVNLSYVIVGAENEIQE